MLATLVVISAMITGCDSSISLFNGKSLEGWECDPLEQAGDWKAVDGELLGENSGEQASIIWTKQKFRDFEVELDYITLTDDYDSGIFIRGPRAKGRPRSSTKSSNPDTWRETKSASNSSSLMST